MSRLDQYIAGRYAISRSFASKLIKEGKVQVHGAVVQNSSVKVSAEAQVLIDPQDLVHEEISTTILPQDLPLSVIYEDEHVLVINKQAGMSVHTSDAQKEGTLLNALVFRYSSLLDDQENRRPGIVHRIDKETSGLLITAKDRKTQEFLSRQFANRSVYKEYSAVVDGIIEHDLVIDKAIARNKKDRKKMGIYENGRQALTCIYPIQSYFLDKEKKYTLVRAVPKTGRTHQIRVHLKSIGHPIVGDTIYHGSHYDHMLLHAKLLRIAIPDHGIMEFQTPEPDYFDVFLSTINPL